MKKLSLLFLFFLISRGIYAQPDTTAPYYQNKTIPVFSLLSLDSIAFSSGVLSQNKKTIIMLFNPDCEHCQQQLQLLLTIPEVINNTNLVLSSTETLQKINTFYTKFRLENYNGVIIGKDFKYFFGGYYRPKTIPVLAFYNKQKQLVYFNQGNVKKKQILQALKK